MMFEFNVIHKQSIQIQLTRLFHFLFPVASISFPSLKPLMRILMRKKMISTPLRMENPVRRPMVPPIIASDDSKVTWKHSSLKINLKKKVIILITVNFKNSEISIQTIEGTCPVVCLSRPFCWIVKDDLIRARHAQRRFASVQKSENVFYSIATFTSLLISS